MFFYGLDRFLKEASSFVAVAIPKLQNLSDQLYLIHSRLLSYKVFRWLNGWLPDTVLILGSVALLVLFISHLFHF